METPNNTAHQSDFFTQLPESLSDGYFIVPRRFVLEDQARLTDSEFLTALWMLIEITPENLTWKPEPTGCGENLGMSAQTVCRSISKILKMNFGFQRNSDGAIDGTKFWKAYAPSNGKGAGEQFVRIPLAWMQNLHALGMDYRSACILITLATLWNPSEDPAPYLSQRMLSGILGVTQCAAKRSLDALPVWVERTSRAGAKSYSLQGFIQHMDLVVNGKASQVAPAASVGVAALVVPAEVVEANEADWQAEQLAQEQARKVRAEQAASLVSSFSEIVKNQQQRDEIERGEVNQATVQMTPEQEAELERSLAALETERLAKEAAQVAERKARKAKEEADYQVEMVAELKARGYVETESGLELPAKSPSMDRATFMLRFGGLKKAA